MIGEHMNRSIRGCSLCRQRDERFGEETVLNFSSIKTCLDLMSAGLRGVPREKEKDSELLS